MKNRSWTVAGAIALCACKSGDHCIVQPCAIPFAVIVAVTSVSAPGYQPSSTSVSVASKLTGPCACAAAVTQSVAIVLTPAT